MIAWGRNLFTNRHGSGTFLLHSLLIVFLAFGSHVANASMWEEQPSDIGNPAKAAITLPEGPRTLHLELVPDMAMLRFAGKQPLSGIQKANAADGVLAGLTEIGTNPASGIALVQVKPGTSVAGAARAASLGLAEVLRKQSGATFAAPVFKLGSRLVGVGDTLLVKFQPALAQSAQCALLLAWGLDPVDGVNGVDGTWVVRIETADGLDVMDKVIELSARDEVIYASVDWYSLYSSAAYTDQFSGTSAAAPAVAGVAALVLSANPDLTYQQVADILKITADKIDPPGGAYDSLGFSKYYGAGKVNAAAAVSRAAGRAPGDPVFVKDPQFPWQWHLYANTAVQPAALPEADMKVPDAWSITMGDPKVKIGVIDSEVDMRHEDLNVVAGYDVFSKRRSCQARKGDIEQGDVESHGTAVAGVIAATANNGIGVAGVAPGLPVVGVRLITDELSASLNADSQIFDAFRFCVDEGAWIINNSWGPAIPVMDFCGDEDDLIVSPLTAAQLDALLYALDHGRGGKGCVVVFSAGNNRGLVDGFGMNAFSKVITVSASNNVARRSLYSNYGNAVDVAGPSNDISLAPDIYSYIPCFDDIWTGGSLGITTTDFQSMPDPLFNLEGVGGYYNLNLENSLSLVTVVDGKETPGFIGVAKNMRRTEIFPVSLSVDVKGVITGVVNIRVTERNGAFVAQTSVPVKGKAKFNTGMKSNRIRVRNNFSFKGSAISLLDGVRTKSSCSVNGKEHYDAYSLDEIKSPRFVTTYSASVGKLASTKSSGNATGITRNWATFFTTDIRPTNTKRSVWAGNAGLQDERGLFRGGNLNMFVEYLTPKNQTPKIKVWTKNDKFSCYSCGFHSFSLMDNPDILTLSEAFEPAELRFRGPSGTHMIFYNKLTKPAAE